ncbi:MAG: hypothetical protein ACJASL_000143 [Paraglaciecola sp.]|jgi:hypothetical protein
MAKVTTKKLIYGVGINDADYKVLSIINGKKELCPFYRSWTNMLARCYSLKYQIFSPSCAGSTVDDKWLIFSVFKSWMEKQDWKGKHLDKDILLQGNKIYKSSGCIFVDQSINKLLTDRKRLRGGCLIGVDFRKREGKYRAQCSVNGKRKTLGYFNSELQAHEVYKAFKYKHIAEIANQQSEPLRTALLNYVIEG